MNKYIKIVFAIAASFVLQSCEDYLDREPLRIIGSPLVYEDESLAEAYLSDIYNNIYNPFSLRYNDAPTYYMTDNCTDNGRTKSGWISSQSVVVPGLMSATRNPGEMSAWKYRAIRKTNEYIENVGASTALSEGFKTQTIAEARWLRAKFYFEMVKRYGDMPLITKAQTLEDELLLPRTPASDIWDFIDKELDEIDDILPYKAKIENGRATKEACWALGSRAMLYAQRWAKCIDYSKRIIDSENFVLNPSYSELFASKGGDAEVIFEILFSGKTTKGHRFDVYNLPFSYAALWGSQTNPTQELVDAYYMSNGLPITDPNSGYDPKHPYENRDPRFYATILYHGAEFKGKVMDTSSPDGPDAINKSGLHTITGYYLRKHLDETLPKGVSWEECTISWKVFRLAEILLNCAEAENELNGPTDLVYNCIKPIRGRLNMDNFEAGLSKEVMREKLRHERRLETAYEDLRWWDLIRWRKSVEVLHGKYFHGVVVTKEEDGTVKYDMSYVVDNRPKQVFLEKHYLQPIPQGERDKNPKLTQNKGY